MSQWIPKALSKQEFIDWIQEKEPPFALGVTQIEKDIVIIRRITR